MSSRPWMPFYVADYLSDTGHLNCAEHGAYLLLIFHYWRRGSLPKEDERLASIASASLEQWLSMKPTISEFFGDGWTHSRVDDELRKSRQAYENRAKAGRKGGLANHQKGKQCSSNAEAMLNQSQSQSQSHIDDADSARRARDTLKIERACREAAGVSQSAYPGLCDMSPILGLIDQGADLESEILPALRAKPNAKAASWRYFVPQIQQSRANRKAAADSPLPDAASNSARDGPRRSKTDRGVASYLKTLYEFEEAVNEKRDSENTGENVLSLPAIEQRADRPNSSDDRVICGDAGGVLSRRDF
jgi:uncharacterized protein YdaU (DUF1376 family)